MRGGAAGAAGTAGRGGVVSGIAPQRTSGAKECAGRRASARRARRARFRARGGVRATFAPRAGPRWTARNRLPARPLREYPAGAPPARYLAPPVESIIVMQQNIDYPQWYRTFRAFVFGTAFGAILVILAVARSESPPLGLVHVYFWPAIINGALFVVTGCFEAAFALRRHRRLVREQGPQAAA